MSGPGTLALIGPGRAGCTIATGLITVGWTMVGVAGGDPDSPSVLAACERFATVTGPATEIVADASLVLIATPDRAIAGAAAEISEAVAPSALVIHLSGSVPLATLDSVVARIGALHPLQTMPEADATESVLTGVWCATAGDPEVDTIARSLGMRPFPVLDADRAGYHAAACIASNHLVALMAHMEAGTDVPLEAFVPLMRSAVDNAVLLGPAAALTGPVARGDVGTVRGHLDALPIAERAAYVALARRAAVLAGRNPDADFDGLLT